MSKKPKPRSLVVKCKYSEEGEMSVYWTPLLLPDTVPEPAGICGLEGRTERWVFEVAVLYDTVSCSVWQMVASRLIDWPRNGQLFLRIGGNRDEVQDIWTWRGPFLETFGVSFDLVEPGHTRTVQTSLDFTVRETCTAALARGICGVPATSLFSGDFPAKKALQRLEEGAMAQIRDGFAR